MPTPILSTMKLLMAALIAGATTVGLAASAQTPAVRLTLWNLKLGTPLAQMPPVEAYMAYACGSNGGPPRQQIKGWSEFAKCRAEASGLHEVYFEYDDEREYIARALELGPEIGRWAGTTEQAYPVIVSVLFDDAGVLTGMRMASDSRPDYRSDNEQAENRSRKDAHLLSAMLAARFDINPKEQCKQLPRAEGESPVGDVFIKQVCERTDEKNGRRITLATNFYRKPGQYGRNPYLETQLTQGQFESSTRLEVVLLGGTPAR